MLETGGTAPRDGAKAAPKGAINCADGYQALPVRALRVVELADPCSAAVRIRPTSGGRGAGI